MGRMIPGRIRNQGIELYEQGLVDVISKQEDLIQANVGKHYLQNSLEDEKVLCDCDFFDNKKYCEHLAAV